MIFLVSMVPIVELRGAIPISQGFQLPLLQSYIICVIGNMLPVPIIYLLQDGCLSGARIKNTLVSFLPSVLKKVTRADRSWKKKQETGYLSHCFYLWVFRFRVQVHGQEHWQPVFWIWDLKRVYLPYWAVCFWQVLSWVLPVQDFSAHFLQSFKEKYKSGFKFINRTGSSRAWEFLIPEDARYFLPEIKENAKK